MNESESKLSAEQEEVKRLKRNEKYKRYRLAHPEKIKQYYLKNKKRLLDGNRIWRARNPEKVRAKRLENYRNNPEPRRASSRKFQSENKSKVLGKAAKWREKNRHKIKEYNARKRQTPEGKLAMIHAAHRRRARRFNCPFPITRKELSKLRNEATHCHYCGRKDAEITLDHFIPLSRGGAHAKENIVPACRSCNSSKGDKDPYEFMRSIGRLL